MITVQQLQQGSRDAAEHPLDHLMACHRRIEDRLATLERAGVAFFENREDALAAIRRSLEFFSTNGVRHTADEEESLFPRMLPMLSIEEAELIAGLERQHEEAERLHDALDRAVEGLRAEAPDVEGYRRVVASLAELYRQHIDVEDSIVMAIARRVLREDQLEAIRAEMRLRRGLEAVSCTSVPA